MNMPDASNDPRYLRVINMLATIRMGDRPADGDIRELAFAQSMDRIIAILMG